MIRRVFLPAALLLAVLALAARRNLSEPHWRLIRDMVKSPAAGTQSGKNRSTGCSIASASAMLRPPTRIWPRVVSSAAKISRSNSGKISDSQRCTIIKIKRFVHQTNQ